MEGPQSMESEEAIAIAEAVLKMQGNAKRVSKWLDWWSEDPFENPFTLLVFELYNFVEEGRFPEPVEKDWVGKSEYLDLGNAYHPILLSRTNTSL